MWNELLPLLSKHGLHLWEVTPGYQKQPEGLPNADNYLHLSANRFSLNTSLLTVKQFLNRNGLSHAARSTRVGRTDCVLRVLTAGGQGQDHLRIMRRLSRPPDILLCNNHILPLIDEIIFEDIVIGVFPKIMHYLGEATYGSYMTSVEDLLHMVLQAFEVRSLFRSDSAPKLSSHKGIAYLHRNLIAHRVTIIYFAINIISHSNAIQDVFMENFLVEWLPESINERSSMTRPRVYIIDFETAVEFPENSLESERVCSSLPFPKEVYSRPVVPEAENGEAYCPFRMDVWQFGTELQDNIKVSHFFTQTRDC